MKVGNPQQNTPTKTPNKLAFTKSDDQTHLKKQSEHTPLDKKQVDYVKILKSLKLQQDLRKLRNFKKIEKQMKHGKNQISEIEQQLQKVQQKIVQKKQELIQKHINQIEHKKKERHEFVHQTNKELHMLKLKNQQKNKVIQFMVKELQQKQLHSYQKTLKERVNKYRNPINFDDIKNHEKKYLELKSQSSLHKASSNEQKPLKKGSLRVKSQISTHHCQNQFQNLSMNHKSRLDERVRDEYLQAKSKAKTKKLQLIKLVAKKKDYGNRVSDQKRNLRVKTEPHSETKRQQESRLFWEKVEKQNSSKMHSKKPRLNTNLPKINLNDYAKLSLRKIHQSTSMNTIQKMQKLKAFEASYVSRTNPQAAQIISQLSLIKADLLLQI